MAEVGLEGSIEIVLLIENQVSFILVFKSLFVYGALITCWKPAAKIQAQVCWG